MASHPCIESLEIAGDAYCPEKKTASAFRHGDKCVHSNHPVPALDFPALTLAISPSFILSFSVKRIIRFSREIFLALRTPRFLWWK
jgi:hypothetical protein